MSEPRPEDIARAAVEAQRIIDALALTAAERQYAEDIGKVLANEAFKQFMHVTQQGHQFRPVAMAASLAYALVVIDEGVRALDRAKK